MGYSKLKSRFAIAGRFVRFAIEDGFKIKGFYLDSRGEELLIKVPKRLRYYCADLLVPGAILQVTGKKTVKLKDDRTKYKADDILPLSTPISQLTSAEASTLVSKDADRLVSTNGNASNRAVGSATALGERPPLQKQPAQGKPACIRVCQKSSCRKRGGTTVWAALEAEIAERDLGDRVKLKATGCMDKCKAGPNLIMPGKMRYSRVSAKSIPGIMEEHFTVEGGSQN